MEFSEVDLDFGGTEVSVMVVFSDLGGKFGVLESEEYKFSGFALVVFGDFTVGDLIGEGLEVLVDLFLREVFGDVLDDDSAHGWFDNTFFIIIWQINNSVIIFEMANVRFLQRNDNLVN